MEKSKILIAVGLLGLGLVADAIGQTQGNQTPPAPQIQFNLTVTPDDLNVMNEGLVGLPYNKVAPLMQKLQGQIMEQQRRMTEQNAKGNEPKVEPKVEPKND